MLVYTCRSVTCTVVCHLHLLTDESLVNTYQSALGAFHERPILPVDSVVETAGIAEVVPCPVSAPERRGYRATVHTLSPICVVVWLHP